MSFQPPTDVRMRGFARRTTVADALAWLDDQIKVLIAEAVPLDRAAGRVLAGDVMSPRDVPMFDRSMMDGFAVRAADTLDTSSYNPIELAIVGESLPGQPFAGEVASRQAVRIMTGAPLPIGADAVLPVESTEIRGQTVLAQAAVSPAKHVGRAGEDVAAGAAVLAAGRVLRPQDVGVLASIGAAEVQVVRQPRVRIVVTGNELLPVGATAEPYKIYDSNGPMLTALVRRDGGIAVHPGIVPDRPESILAALTDDADIVLVSGGSSVGQEDHAPALVMEHGELPIHGIAMRPSSPTGLGRLGGRLVVLLPGNPVSCLCAYDFFAGRSIRGCGGRSTDWPYQKVTATLDRKIVSTIGRLEYMRVRMAAGRAEPLAVAGSSILTSTTRAAGFVLVPPDSEGYPPGTEVEVYLYDDGSCPHKNSS
jgi:molybdopterin molybdotransferase